MSQLILSITSDSVVAGREGEKKPCVWAEINYCQGQSGVGHVHWLNEPQLYFPLTHPSLPHRNLKIVEANPKTLIRPFFSNVFFFTQLKPSCSFHAQFKRAVWVNSLKYRGQKHQSWKFRRSHEGEAHKITLVFRNKKKVYLQILCRQTAVSGLCCGWWVNEKGKTTTFCLIFENFHSHRHAANSVNFEGLCGRENCIQLLLWVCV